MITQDSHLVACRKCGYLRMILFGPIETTLIKWQCACGERNRWMPPARWQVVGKPEQEQDAA